LKWIHLHQCPFPHLFHLCRLTMQLSAMASTSCVWVWFQSSHFWHQ
jgi:hypothetical protein